MDEGRERTLARARRVLGWALRVWPARHRHTLGESAVDTAARMVAEHAHGGHGTNWGADRGAAPGTAWGSARELAGEFGSLVLEGVRLRMADARAARGAWFGGWSRDVRFAARTLARAPGFTAVAAVTLALGIGANAAVFSLVDGVLLRPPPYERPDELVVVWNTLPGTDERIPVAGPDAAILAERSRTLVSVGFSMRGVDGAIESGQGDVARHVRMTAVTWDFFRVLGVTPALGRGFTADDGPDGAAGGAGTSIALVSHALWRDALAGDPQAVGREVRLNGLPVVVAGVMPPDFKLAVAPDAVGADGVDVWLPLGVPLTAFHRTDDRLLDQDSDNTGVVVARLPPGVTPDALRAEMEGLGADLRSEVPAYAAAGLGFDARPLHADATAHARPVLLTLLAGVGVVLLVACLNIATLVLVRGMGRRREFAVRVSLGAGRARLVRQLAVEGAVLGGLALVAASVVAQMTLAGLAGFVPPDLAPPGGLALDPRTMGVMAALAVGAAALCGLAPAIHLDGDLAANASVRGGGGGGRAAGRARRALVAAEIACSVVLVLGAALLVRTVGALQAVDPGFRAEGALTFRVSLRVPESYRGPADRAGFMSELEGRLEALPGVQAVGLVGVLPFGGDRWTQPYGLPGQAESEWRANRADYRVATSGYFEALGARLVEGRTFTPSEDLVEGERVVVIDQTLARRIAPDGSAVDAVIGVPVDGAPVQARVVGVVAEVRAEQLDAPGRETIYVPYRQEASREVAVVVRAADDQRAVALAPAVHAALRDLDPRIPAYDLRTLASYVDRSMAPRRFALALLLAFAGLALVCAAIGLYGVVAFDVRQRTRDIGLRMALGAERGDVVRGVLASGLRLGGAGLLLGVLLGLAAAGLARGLVFGVAVLDPLTWGAVIGAVAGVTLLASWAPARRASRLSPVEALRAE